MNRIKEKSKRRERNWNKKLIVCFKNDVIYLLKWY